MADGGGEELRKRAERPFEDPVEVQRALASAVNPLQGQYDHVETDYMEGPFLILKGEICVLLVSVKEVYASEVSAMRVSKLEYGVNEGID